MESRLAEIGGHRAIRKETSIELQFLHLLANAAFLLLGQLALPKLLVHRLVSQVVVGIGTDARIPQAAVEVGILA